MNKVWYLLLPVFLLQLVSSAQSKEDTSSLFRAFRKGTLHGHLRNIMMVTNNASGLTNYRADAIGGHILYETDSFHGFRFSAGMHFSYRLFSSGLTTPDPATNVLSRYESTLFDISNMDARNKVMLLSVLNVSYQYKSGKITFGRQLLNTPFVNTQDNRMQPTSVEGIYTTINKNKWKIETGWLYRIAPRGTLHWYGIGASLGKYPQGTNNDGAKGNYLNNVQSHGIGLLGIHFLPKEYVHFQLWEQYSENLFNTLLLQADYKIPAANHTWITGIQLIQQQVVHQGGNAETSKTYFNPSDHVHIIGVRAGWENDRGQVLVNYTRITGSGRFTMPREWGTEPLFTFLSRERNEGAGNVNAATITAMWSFFNKHLVLDAGYGRYLMPDVKQYVLNKYGVPSYDHYKLGINYWGSGWMSNMKIAALMIYKGEKGADYNNLRYVINKVDLTHFACVINYIF
ncbi:OprD family outer membrane porin [Chitinophaga sancti]|uniref:OprD family outer membrane porin n=1 Tax=Chitinophaga sancti TaxID=1004 RepID=A0A1K1SR77_9BACT|nr:OprD family outer membrane porin [Chitinophaga sancti]WQD65341.1 OprD family outer membrane porin [Chitinophaga sancti]WQG89035.1 OprD family outer membrane porin [Chitinophaga sancti]SFW86802.1 outer membrane porin, OprD family [Chitinophaga sancti]